MKKIDFLNTLFKLLHCRGDILDHLKKEDLITDDQKVHILHSTHATHASQIMSLLASLESQGKLQMVDYTWHLLPKEYMKLSIISQKSHKDFIYE